jgi:hypothetical protein
LNTRIAVIPDLFKLTIMSFAGNPAQGNAIKANSGAIVTLALRFPDEEPIFYFRSVVNCTNRPDERQKMDCQSVKGDTSRKTFIFLEDGSRDFAIQARLEGMLGKSRGAPTRKGLLGVIPTYVIAPNRPTTQILTFGFQIRKEFEP